MSYELVAIRVQVPIRVGKVFLGIKERDDHTDWNSHTDELQRKRVFYRSNRELADLNCRNAQLQSASVRANAPRDDADIHERC